MPKTKEEILKRISMLSHEIGANEEENNQMQDEINKLYGKLDALLVSAALEKP